MMDKYMNITGETDRYPLLENIRRELTALLNENDYLRAENERLREYEHKYNELIADNIRHNNEMIATMLRSCLNVPNGGE